MKITKKNLAFNGIVWRRTDQLGLNLLSSADRFSRGLFDERPWQQVLSRTLPSRKVSVWFIAALGPGLYLCRLANRFPVYQRHLRPQWRRFVILFFTADRYVNCTLVHSAPLLVILFVSVLLSFSLTKTVLLLWKHSTDLRKRAAANVPASLGQQRLRAIAK